MARLIARTPAAGLLPLSIGAVTLTEVDPGPVTSVAPFRGQTAAVSAALQAAFGFGLPGPNQTAQGQGARILWAGLDRALLIGAAAPGTLAVLAALVDQSDSSVILRIEGPAAEAVLARLVPLDLREGPFPQGATARSFVNHMTAAITRVAPRAFEVMVFRSMAATLVRELAEAAQGVAARG